MEKGGKPITLDDPIVGQSRKMLAKLLSEKVISSRGSGDDLVELIMKAKNNFGGNVQVAAKQMVENQKRKS